MSDFLSTQICLNSLFMSKICLVSSELLRACSHYETNGNEQKETIWMTYFSISRLCYCEHLTCFDSFRQPEQPSYCWAVLFFFFPKICGVFSPSPFLPSMLKQHQQKAALCRSQRPGSGSHGSQFPGQTVPRRYAGAQCHSSSHRVSVKRQLRHDAHPPPQPTPQPTPRRRQLAVILTVIPYRSSIRGMLSKSRDERAGARVSPNDNRQGRRPRKQGRCTRWPEFLSPSDQRHFRSVSTARDWPQVTKIRVKGCSPLRAPIDPHPYMNLKVTHKKSGSSFTRPESGEDNNLDCINRK